jgi:hypothetical protein
MFTGIIHSKRERETKESLPMNMKHMKIAETLDLSVHKEVDPQEAGALKVLADLQTIDSGLV